MSDKKIRWGVISTANIGRWAVIPAIQASTNGELAAVASRQIEHAREFAGKNNIPVSYGSYEALLEADDIDAVYIPLPNSLHREWSIKAAEAGKHVLCEKPLAMNAAECLEMDAAARQYGVKLMEAFMYRFHPRTERVLSMVREGVVGDLRYIHSAFTFRVTNPDNIRLKPELGGGSLMDVGSYCVNLSRTAAGEEPVEVQAHAEWGASGVDERMAGTLRFASGVIAQFDCALSMERREEYLLAGTDAYLKVDSAFLPGKDDVTIEERRGRAPAVEHPISGVDEYRQMVVHFARCILEDKAPRYSAQEAAANMRVIEALYRSARMDGRPAAITS